MEEDIGLHGRKKRKARSPGGLVQEIGARDFPIVALQGRLAHDQIDQIHLAHNVLEGPNGRIGDFATCRDVAQGRKLVQDVVRKLVPRGLKDNALEVLRLDVTVAILVKHMEGLADPLTLQPPEHLGELRVCHVMPALTPSTVQGGPVRVPVKGYAVLGLGLAIQVVKRLPFHAPRPIGIEQSEGDLIFGIGLSQQVLEGGPISQAQLPSPPLVGDIEQNTIVFSLDFTLLNTIDPLATFHQDVFGRWMRKFHV